MKQASLDSIFEFEKTTTTTVKYKMTVPLKKCKECKEWKPKSEFYTRNDTSRLRKECKECFNKQVGVQYSYHSNKWWRQRVYYFLYRHIGRSVSGYMYGQGICLICGEIHPLVLQNHHAVPWDDEFVVSLCANCHRKYQSTLRERHMSVILNAVEHSKFLWDYLDIMKLHQEVAVI